MSTTVDATPVVQDDEQKKKDTDDNAVVVVVDDGDDSDEEEEIDDEQLEEYKEMVDDLGTFPDKVKINSLSMVAEDHAESSKNAAAIYNIIRESLISTSVHCDRKLPLVYVVDSILKNVKGRFIPIVEKDAANWLPVVYQALPEEKRAKLEKVWNLWNKKGVFAKANWEEMGRCFSEKKNKTTTTTTTASKNDGSDMMVDSDLEKAGLSFGVRLLLLLFQMISVCFNSMNMIMKMNMNMNKQIIVINNLKSIMFIQCTRFRLLYNDLLYRSIAHID